MFLLVVCPSAKSPAVTSVFVAAEMLRSSYIGAKHINLHRIKNSKGERHGKVRYNAYAARKNTAS